MRANVGPLGQRAVAHSRMIAAADVSGLPTGSILWADHANEFWVVVPGGVAPISLLAERAGRPPPDGEPADWMAKEFALVSEGKGRVPTNGTAQRHVIAWVQEAQRAHPNPAHLTLDGQFRSGLGRQDASHLALDGTFSFGVGSKDDRAMQSNAYDYERGPGNYGLTDEEVWDAAERIAGSEDWFGRWQRAHDSGDWDSVYALVADAAHAPVQNLDAAALAEVSREIARLRSGGRKHARNARRRSGPVRSELRAEGEVVVSSVLYRGIWAVPVRLEVRAAPGPADVRFSFGEKHQQRETRVRVASALAQLGLLLEVAITVHVDQSAVAGATGYSGLDLPIALALLALDGRVPRESLRGTMAVGELALDGSLRPVRGAAVAAVGANVDDETEVLLVPAENEVEARFLAQTPVMSFGNLSEVVSYMQAREIPREPPIEFEPCKAGSYEAHDPGLPTEAVHAAQHGQNLLLVGPPGAGKTMAARYIHSTLPSLSVADAKELTEIYSVAGLLQNHYACARPFRAPHHTVSEAGLIGGGEVVRPGEVTLAHGGVLMLDEVTEFRKSALIPLSRALQEGRVVFNRGGTTMDFPAHPLVVIGAANPCPCGNLGTSRPCRCSTLALASYEERLREYQAFFAMQRVDLRPLTVAEMTGGSMRRNAKGDIIWQDTLLTWKSVGDRGIEMIPSADGRVRAQDMLEERESEHGRRSPRGSLSEQGDFLESAMGNGWSYVPPEDIGALTDATIVSQDGFIGDDGKWYPHPDVESPVVYAHMDYAVEDPIESWAEGKPVFWMADVLSVTPEQRARARNEHAMVSGGSYESNARKNVSAVIDAFLAGRRHSEKTCSTDGERIYSYSLPIAARLKNGQVVVLDKARSPSVTTSSQINAVLSAIPSAESVDSIPGEHTTNSQGGCPPGSNAFMARYVHKVSPRPEDVAGPFCINDNAFSNRTTLAAALRNAGVLQSGARVTSFRVEGEKVVVFPSMPGLTTYWHSVILTPAEHAENAKRGEFKAPKGLSQAEEFFFKWAGHSYPAGASVKEQKRARVDHAKALAAAEAEAEDRGWTYQWDYDQEADTSWMDEEALEEFREGRTEMLDVLLKDENGNVLGSLGGVHVRATGSGRDPYGRVVEAELAQEALEAERSSGTAMALNRGQRRQARNPVFRHMDLGEIEQILGAQEIARVMSADRPEAHARSRATGWWDANEPDYHDAYTNLARMLKAGVLDDLVAEARGAR